MIYNGLRFSFNSGYWRHTRAHGPVIYLHKYVWELQNGPVPDGHCIHHIDHNKANNDINNLQLMHKSDHVKHHKSTKQCYTGICECGNTWHNTDINTKYCSVKCRVKANNKKARAKRKLK